ncbi:ATP-grasp ribosomal peptide maturase [Streptomyces ipomoeae]|jgi:ATP-grasp ribosomal peptide maturase|uniref:ATP-grasp ribosomal peptide maturase n=1 Tax=Streptomyces ipomoeae TaxID=103232 RepID=A0AAE9AVW7_9ACTN|nr:ATP-grasp ribosomal peptide maturase [Streptomyces ipomoeae]MDX2695649.1 ATP-grasp ribosomal peptide maturase [Streptomyces ipomoeae]MDX2821353.1 ATP-grasp ribosomal peptide maturase [Streptomyces ipomoeae]MDX2841616.1 ATP-grasp ribosomal peptide maturase [Streptomyces ipomoeae]MDX2873658.1 ATP-grasp ribosomal peptide maturase [Streptomyces ipomoeae]TQE15327.1 ATP-grasp ribosomal peptide maturase [Streptomyces ipomoeae]
MASTVLVVTALEDFTADKVIAALNEREVPVVRVDPADIGPGLSFGFRIGEDGPAWGGRLCTASRTVELGEVAAVYYRRPTPYAARFGHLPLQQREFAVAEARHGLGGVLNHLPGVRYVNHPSAVARADFKPAQLQRFAELGLAIPPTLVTNDVEQARKFAAEHEPVIYKTFRGLPPGEDGHTGAIWAQRVDPGTFDDALTVTAHLFQAEIPKTGDVRVTVVGRRVFAQQIAAPDGALDWRRGDWDELLHAPITVPAPIEATLHRYLASFGLVFGCFDFGLTGDGDDPRHWTAIECNPNGQWGWLPDAPAITEAFADILSRKEAAGDDHASRP